ncbi:MAG: response regulator [Bacteroidota bacterium]
MQTEKHDVTILLVDDDEVDARAIRRAFRKKKVANTLIRAHDGLEALDIVRGTNGREPIARPYLILLDLKMPRMNGLAFLEALRADPVHSDAIVFVLTTSDDEQDILGAYEHNVAGYLLKQDAAGGLMKHVEMLDQFMVSVQFPST